MFVYSHPCNFYVGQGIACQTNPANVMQCRHSPTIIIIRPMSKSFPSISFIPHPHNYPHKYEINGRRCLPYPAKAVRLQVGYAEHGTASQNKTATKESKHVPNYHDPFNVTIRSEERRVGKECR